MESAASSKNELVKEAETKFNVASKKLENFLRNALVGRPRTLGDTSRRCLALMGKELQSIAESLKSDSPPLHDLDYYRAMGVWLKDLVDRDASEALRKILPPRSSTLLSCCHCPRRRRDDLEPDWCRAIMGNFFRQTELPQRWYTPLLSAGTVDIIDKLVLPPQDSDDLVMGMDRPMKKLLRCLMPSWNQQLGVMAVLGPVGIGKTTLAMALHTKCQPQAADSGSPYDFHFNIMVQVSRRDDRIELLLHDIFSKIEADPETSIPSSMSDLVGVVFKRLQDKRYFICIDDIREASDWDKIKGAFPNNNLGSRVLITTSVGTTARACCSDSDGFVYQMKPLDKEDSERLLLRTRAAVPQGNTNRFVVDRILMRCEGVPLFINGMADWLQEHVFRSQQQNQQHGEDDDDEEQNPKLPKQLQQALSSAYDDLPYHLKALLLYLTMFPYGYKFDKHCLITRFLREMSSYWAFDREPREEDLRQLVDRNFITRVAAISNSNLDRAEAFQLYHVNHFMHQFLASKSAEIGFGITSDTLDCLANGCDRPRRLALHSPRIPSLLRTLDLMIKKKTLDLTQTRSLAVSGAVSGIHLDMFVNLLVLDLEGWENLTDEDLLRICRSKMFFLGHLSVRNTGVTKLPQEIKNLSGLQVLDVSYTQISELPLEVFEIEFMIQLDLRGTRFVQLPSQIAKLKYFRYLLLGDEGTTSSEETTTKLPHEIRNVWKLLTLASVDLSKQPASFIIALGDLQCLEVLAITWSFHQCTNQDYREALLSSIQKWEELNSLTIHCGLGCSMEFLGSLSNPPKKLKELKVIAGRFACVPKWIGKLNCLSFLQITICNQGMEDLNIILRGLPELKCLILGFDFIPGEAIVIGSDGFTKLQRFSVDCPMPWLTFSTGAMPNLTCLQLKFCAIPERPSTVPSGLGNLRKLTEVFLCYNGRYVSSPSVKMTVEAVKEQVAMHRNPIDLFINGVGDYDVQKVDKMVEAAAGTQSGTKAESQCDVQAVGKKPTSEIEEIQSEA